MPNEFPLHTLQHAQKSKAEISLEIYCHNKRLKILEQALIKTNYAIAQHLEDQKLGKDTRQRLFKLRQELQAEKIENEQLESEAIKP